MNKLQILKVALLIVILAEEIKRANKYSEIEIDILSVKTDISDMKKDLAIMQQLIKF